MKVHMFYSADLLKVATEDADWVGQDGARVAMLCADSWARKGWQVNRVRTPHVPPYPAGSPLNKQPYVTWLEQLRELAPCWWTEFDVYNHSWLPEYVDIPIAGLALACGPGEISLACGWATKEGVTALINSMWYHALDYAGMIDAMTYEQALREMDNRKTITWFRRLGIMGSPPIKPESRVFPLQHYMRGHCQNHPLFASQAAGEPWQELQ